MTQLKGDITTDIANQTQWPNVHNQTKTKISRMMNYYNNTHSRSEVVQKTKSDRKDLKQDFKKHEDLASCGLNTKRDLTTQVESSDNRVQRLIKYGRPAAAGFAILGAVIGGAIGAKLPGWGQVAAIVVGVVIGFIGCAVVGLVVYLVLKWKFIKLRDMWMQVQSSSQGGVELVGLIKEKKSCLSEIRNQLNDIEEDNIASGLPVLLQKMTEYLRETTGNHGQFNQV